MAGTKRTAGIVLALFVVLQIVLAWYPFEFESPHRVDNTVAVNGTSATFTGTSILVAPKRAPWLTELLNADSVVVELRARAATAEQFGPARLLAISRTLRRTDLVIGQQGDDLELRVRREGSNADGTPSMRVPGLFADSRAHDIQLRLDRSGVELAVDGAVAAKDPADASPLRTWDRTARLSLGDDVSYGREWQGVLEQATVAANGGAPIDLLAAGVLERPDGHWVGTDRITNALSLRFDGHWGIAIGRVLLAVPIGWALAVFWRRRVLAAVVGFLVLAFVNAGKVYVAGRHPYLLDVVISTFGVVAGVALANVDSTSMSNDRSARTTAGTPH
ncbi:MAG: VanZ family protein [Acidimicrobiia bacterium]